MDSLESLVVGEEGFTLKDIVKVFLLEANSIVRNWTDFARELRIHSAEIETLRINMMLDKMSLNDVLYMILVSWKEREGKDASLANLLKHLEQVDLKRVADKLREFFSKKYRVSKGQQLFKQTLPSKPRHYIPRMLITRGVIDVKVFLSTAKDIFVVDGIDRYRLSQLAKKELTDTSTKQVRKRGLSVRFILLERLDDWSLLCGKATNPIHLLRFHGGRFHWISTKGDISPLQKASDEKNQNELSEEEFIEKIETEHKFQTNNPICISDSPGTGKSLLLASIGRQLQERYAERIVAFAPISEFVVKIETLLPEFGNTERALMEALLRMLCENNSARKQLVQKFNIPTEEPSTQIELMLDGFDEISFENLGLAHKCLDTLKTNFHNTIRVWVTTRPQHRHALEKRLSVPGYNIQAFQEKHQIEFLTSFWNSETMMLDGNRLEIFSKKCVRTLKKILNKNDQDIAGIPLQCMMIAEVYFRDAHRFGDCNNKGLEHSAGAEPCIDVNSIADMYEKMIAFKIEKFLETYPLQSEEIRNIWPLHMYLALELIFPSHIPKFKDTLQIESGLDMDYLVNIGILERRGSTTEDPVLFIHKSFAEYLVARFIFIYVISDSTTDVRNTSGELTEFIFSHVLECTTRNLQLGEIRAYCEYLFKHSVLCHFLDALLGFQAHNSIVHCISKKSTKNLKNILYACINSDFGNIVKFLRSLKFPENFSITHIDPEILSNATTIASSDMLKILLESFEYEPLNTIKGKFPDQPSVLHAAVRRGNYEIFDYILKEHNFEDLVKKDERFLDLVYCAVEGTADRYPNEIQDRVEIVTDLCCLNRQMLDYCDRYKRTPLFATSVNITLLKTLIDCGINLLHIDDSGNTILHKATEYLSPIDYCSLLEFIPKATLISLLKLRNNNDELSLHLVVKLGLATRSMLNLYLSSGFDLNRKGKRDYTCIFYALKMENEDETIPTIKLLLENGVDHTRVCFNGDSILHYSAEMGRVDCLRFFLKEKKMNINQINDFGNTPIFNALHNHDSALVTLRYLLKKGADYQLLNLNGNNLLHYSASFSQMECLQLFLRLGRLDINQTDEYKDQFETRNFVGFPPLDVNATNCDNDTPLHLVFKNIKNYHYDFKSFLQNILSLGADINAKNNEGETPLLIYRREFSKWQDEIKQKATEIDELLKG